MKLRIAHVSRSRSGQPVRAERQVEAEVITLGRAAGSTLHLPDPRVALEHARISRAADGVWLTMLRAGGAGAQRVKLVPEAQTQIGPYLLVVETTPDELDLALSIELIHPLPDGRGPLHARARLALADTWLSKRVPSLLLALVIVGLFLVWPLRHAFDTAEARSATTSAYTPDLAWNPGPLAAPHHLMSRRCGECHQQPFVRVRDQACAECHRDVDGHARDPQLQRALFGQDRCASCHADHKGALALAHPPSQDCTSCHATLRERVADSTLEPIGDFARAHADFKLTLWRGPGKADLQRDFVRVAADGAQRIERSGLKFPHEVHLKPGLQGPEGKEKLGCADCHQAASDGGGFVSISMPSHCQRCHSLEFEPLVSTRQAPHGDVERVVQAIAEFYRAAAVAALPVDSAPAAPLQRTLGDAIDPAVRARAERWAQVKARRVARDLIEVRACVVCHEIAPAGKGGWSIEPVHIVQQWLPAARFSHQRHRATPCADCHKVETSKRSEDIAIPQIKTCRECHDGTTAGPNKVASPCLMCHAFHLPQRAQMVVEGRAVGAEGLSAVLPVRRVREDAK